MCAGIVVKHIVRLDAGLGIDSSGSLTVSAFTLIADQLDTVIIMMMLRMILKSFCELAHACSLVEYTSMHMQLVLIQPQHMFNIIVVA